MSTNHPIPYEDFGGNGPTLHFLHANGYPPKAYQPLLERFAARQRVLAMRMRPLWPGADPAALSDWRPFAGDLARFLDQEKLKNVIGVGHSVGATTTLRLALQQPERFSALVLIDPVFFPPSMILFWNLIYRLGLGYRLHPLVKGTLRRRTTFEGRQAMFDNYRKKSIFRRLNDEALQAYVNSLACPGEDGQVRLCYPPAWEARIYLTGERADMQLWRSLPRLRPPLLILRGAESDTFWERTACLVQRKLPTATIQTIPETTHLLPLEAPQTIYELAQRWINASAA